MVQSWVLFTDVCHARWKYVPTVVGDGNFKQDHLKMRNPEEDVPLSDSEGYMVGKHDFEQYLRLTDTALDTSAQVSCLQRNMSCTNFVGLGVQ